jgi:hypothetical protein
VIGGIAASTKAPMNGKWAPTATKTASVLALPLFAISAEGIKVKR